MTDTEKKLTEHVIEELILELLNEEEALDARQMAYNKIIKGENFQIQITVTRDDRDFLEFFQTTISMPFDK